MDALVPEAQDIVAELERKLNERTVERDELLEQQIATDGILKVIASSPSDVQPVFDAIAASANRLIGGFSATVMRFIGDGLHLVASTPTNAAADEALKASFPRPLAEFPPFELVRGGETVQFADTEAVDVPPVNRQLARLRGYRSMLFTPLMSNSTAIGILSVTRVQPGEFAKHHVQLLKTFADQAVIAIENARLFNETQEALERQTATAEILKVIASSPSDVQPVFDAIAERSKRLVDALSTTVCEIADGMMHLTAFTSTNPDADAALRAMFPAPLSTFSWSEAVSNGDIYRVVDTEHEIGSLRDLARLRGFRSMLFVPLLCDRKPIGVIAVTRVEPGPFAEHHVHLLQTFADQAVIAIENARLFNETREGLERQTATADVLRVIARSRSDLQPVFEAIAESAKRLSGGHSATVTRVIDDMVHLAAFTAGNEAGKRELQSSFPTPLSSSGIHSRVARIGERAFRTDIETEPDVSQGVKDLARARGYRSILVVPMRREGVSIGTIGVTRRDPGPFADKIVDLLNTFADQAVIAIENARLLNELRHRTDDLTEALTYQTGSSNILKVIASSPTDAGPVLQAIVNSACELCEADDAVVYLRDGDELSYAAHRGPIPPGLEKRRINRNFVTGRSIVDKVAIHLHDVLSEEGAEFPGAQQISARSGTRTLLSVPLLREGESVGVIVLRRKQVHPFSDKQIAILKTFADQAVIAIGNVHLFEEVRAKTRDLTESLRQQTATSEVLQAISNSSGDLQPIFDAMLANATHICNAKFGMMWLIEGPTARCVALHNVPPAFAELRRREPVIRPGPNTAMGRLLKTRQIVHVEDAMAERAYIEGDPVRRANSDLGGARTILAVPMLKENEVIGAIGIFHQEVRPFNEKQIGLVTNFANQAVIAIENARLLNQLRERTTELSQSLDELRTAQDRLVQTEKLASLGQLTAGIAHEIKNPLNFVNNFSSLSAELTDELNDVLKPVAMEDKVRGEVDELTGLLKENLEKVVQHGKRADSIVKNMLLHSRGGSGEHRPADINLLLDESLNLAYHGARAEKGEFNVTLQREFDADAGTLELFPQEITRAFLNLISNGVYAATRRKTEDNEPGFEPTLRATTKNLGSTVEIRIRDNGTGIPAEVQEKMFNPFFTTKPAGEGTGLGLSMTHDIIVKQHGGRIDVATEPGQFTEFTIVLPRKSAVSGGDRGET
jgi:two-component system NtrC family sensor kinase